MMYAQYRLTGRLGVIPMLLPLFWAVVWPILMLTDHAVAAPGPVEGALWLASVAVPASIAVILAYCRADVAGALWSFTTPDLHRRWLASNVVTALALGVVSAAAMAPIAGFGAAAGAFSVSLASYTLLTVAFDAAFHRVTRVAGAALTVAAIWKSWALGQAVTAYSLVASPVLAGAALTLLVRSFSQANMRANIFAWSAAAGTERSARLYWKGRTPERFTWARSLATTRLLPHVHAALHIATRGERFLAGYLLWNAAYGVLAYRLLGSAWWIAFSAGMSMLVLGAYSRLGHLSLGRALRARVAYASALVLLVGFTVATLAILPLGELVPFGLFDDSPRNENLVAAIGAMIALAPITQWGSVRWGTMHSLGLHSRFVGPFLLFFVYILAVQGLTALAGMDMWGVQPWASLKVTVPLTLVTQAGFWYAVRRYYASADLAPAP